MKITIKKLSRDEYRSLLEVVRYTFQTYNQPISFGEYQIADGLRGLAMKMLSKSMDLREKNTLTLTDLEAYALYRAVEIEMLPIYERAMMIRIFGAMDQAWRTQMDRYQMNENLIYGLQ